MRISDWSSDVCSSDLAVIDSVTCTVIRSPSTAAGALTKVHRAVLRRSRHLLSDQGHHLCHLATRCQHSSGDDSVTSTSGGEDGFIDGFGFTHQNNEASAARAMVTGEPVFGGALAGTGPVQIGRAHV